MKRIFIGSSSKEAALSKSYTIRDILKELGAEPICWSKAFPLTGVTIDTLIETAHSYDAGVFIFDKDDEIIRSGQDACFITRDNVIAETGMFFSALGKESVVLCTISDMKKASDFDGITTLHYDQDSLNSMKEKLRYWLEHNVKEHDINSREKNVLMLSRGKINAFYPVDNRLHISDGYYKQIRHIKIMNFASNTIINPQVSEIEHFPSGDIKLSWAIEKIMKETNADVKLILTKPSKSNLEDMKTKIANQSAGAPQGTLYTALATLYHSLINTDTILAKRSFSIPVLFHFYVMKTSMPYAIFNVEFSEEFCRFNHVRVDLYSASIRNDDNRRSFIIWQKDDSDNYKFFVDNFDQILTDSSLCEEVTRETLKKWAEKGDEIMSRGYNS